MLMQHSTGVAVATVENAAAVFTFDAPFVFIAGTTVRKSSPSEWCHSPAAYKTREIAPESMKYRMSHCNEKATPEY